MQGCPSFTNFRYEKPPAANDYAGFALERQEQILRMVCHLLKAIVLMELNCGLLRVNNQADTATSFAIRVTRSMASKSMTPRRLFADGTRLLPIAQAEIQEPCLVSVFRIEQEGQH